MKDLTAKRGFATTLTNIKRPARNQIEQGRNARELNFGEGRAAWDPNQPIG
jgi:hypothetical protein